MKTITLPLFLSLCTTVVMFTSCNFKTTTPDISGNTIAVAGDSLRITITPEDIDSMLFMPNEMHSFQMDMADCKLLSGYLSQAVYDTTFNNSGIMIKMQSPDYTVAFYYKNRTSNESDMLMIWKENGRAKFANEWYNLSENSRNDVYSLLEKYNKPVE